MSGQRIFISYPRVNEDAARRLYRDLKAAGLHPWLDQEELLPGQKWEAGIRTAIRESRYFIVLLSKANEKRSYVNKELSQALDILDLYPEKDIYLIPVRLEDCEISYEKLQSINYIDMFAGWEAGLRKILRAVEGSNLISSGNEYKTQTDLRIDDVIVSTVSKRSKYFLTWAKYVELDVRIRNKGNSVVNITRADLHVISRLPYTAMYKPSASYNLIVDGEHNILSIAHALQPGEIDRLIIRLGFTKYNSSCSFEAELILTYNGNYSVKSSIFKFESVFG